MIGELELDFPSVQALIPLVGTPLFKQVIKDKDKLLIDDWNLDEVWKTPLNQAQSKFVIKPYNMSVDDLYKWRQKFDILQAKNWKTNTKQKTILQSNKVAPDNTGVFPRVIHGGNRSSEYD
jgi:hypothetical protein